MQKLLLSRTSYIDYPEPPYGLEIADKRTAAEWLEAAEKYGADQAPPAEGGEGSFVLRLERFKPETGMA